MGVTITSKGNARQRKRQAKIATKKGYAMAMGKGKKVRRLSKRAARIEGRSKTYTSTGEVSPSQNKQNRSLKREIKQRVNDPISVKRQHFREEFRKSRTPNEKQ